MRIDATLPDGLLTEADFHGKPSSPVAPLADRTPSRCPWRIALGLAWLASPALAELGLDASRRGAFLAGFTGADRLGYVRSVAGSLLCFGLLGILATWSRTRVARRSWHALLVVYATVALGFQTYTFARYHAYMDDRAVLLGTALLPSIGQQLWHDRWTVLGALGPPLAYALVTPSLLRALRGGSPFSASIDAGRDVYVVLLAVTLFGYTVDSQQASPSSLYVHAMGQYARARWDHNAMVERVHPERRRPSEVPRLHARPAAPRNVLFVLTESVRADMVCVEPREPCEVTPFTNVALPERLPLGNVRSLGSTTAQSVATMWTGLPPESSRDDFHRAPLLWEYARAADVEASYFTSQNLLFGNSGVWLESVPFTNQFSATHLEPDPPLEVGAKDSLLFARALEELRDSKEPWLSVLHLSNTHYPYRFPEDDAPFQPENDQTGPYYQREITNRYKNAIHHQDRDLAEFVRTLRARPGGERTVILFLSDHAEQLHEHGAHAHTGSLFDVEIRVPAWIDAPPGTLSDQERAQLVALAHQPLTTLDVFPTLMDLLGLWKNQDLGAYGARVPGESWLRGGSPATMSHVLTNCNELWACAFKNWGALQGNRKVFAMQGDREWRCYDTDVDPTENEPLPLEHCRGLVPIAETLGRPF